MGRVGLDSTRVQTRTETPFPDAAYVGHVGVSPQIDLSKYAHLPALMKVSDVMRESSLSKGVIFRELKSGRLKSVTPTPRARRIPVEYFAQWVELLKAEAAGAAHRSRSAATV